jgi:CTP synthase
MQMAVIEYSRNVLGYADANSTEMNEHTEHPVVSLMEEQKNITDKGGTMRLGAWKCDLKADSLAYKIYGQSTISERHRHRYEYSVTMHYKSRIESVRSESSWLKSWK